MRLTSRRHRPVLEVFYRYVRAGWTEISAGNMTALEVTHRLLEPCETGWTPAEISTLLFLRETRERWR